LIESDEFDIVNITGDEEIVTFLCGKDGKRVEHPVRGRRFKHYQCFDFEVYNFSLIRKDGSDSPLTASDLYLLPAVDSQRSVARIQMVKH
jgi:hypothetical protein